MASGERKRHVPGDSVDFIDKDSSDFIPSIPPDGGWGWVIVASSFLCNAVVDGLAYSFGVLLPKWVYVFQESRGKVALVGSLLAGMYMCAGPLVSGLTNKFGCRAVTIAGSIFATMAFLVASFSESITTLLLTYGFLGGLGFGLIYLPSIVVVGYYFEKKRALATGIALCGSGIGTLMFATANAYMLEVFSWRSLVMIQAGIVLNASVFGMLMRPLEPTKKTKKSLIKAQTKNTRKKTAEIRKLNMDELTDLREINNRSKEEESMSQTSFSENTEGSLKDSEAYEMYPTTDNINGKKETKLVQSDSPLLNHHTDQADDNSRPIYRQDNGNIQNISEFKSSQPEVKECIASTTNIPDIPIPSFWDRCTCLLSSVVDTFRELMDFSLLTDFSFIMISMGNIFVITGYYVPFTYVVDHALQSDVSRTNAAFLLSIIGIANTIGRIASGVLVDILKFDALVINNVALVLSTVLLFVEPFCETYGLLLAFSILYGFSVADYVSLTPIIICDLLGLKKLTNAFGLLTLARGVAGLYGPPVAGAVFNSTGSYSYSFWFGGLMFALGAACHLVLHLPCVKKQGRKEELSREIVITEEKEVMLNDLEEQV